MQFPIRVDYAARAVIDLGERWGEGPIRSADIAQRRAIPEAFLDQVLLDLRRAGIIRSARGPAGGHELAQSPASFTLGQVFHAVGEGGLRIQCMRDGHCIVFDNCVLQDVWHDLAASSEQILNAVTIADLVRREAERKAGAFYSI